MAEKRQYVKRGDMKGLTTAQRFSLMKEQYAQTGFIPEEYHGTSYAYRVYDCHCEKCEPVWKHMKALKASELNARRGRPFKHGTITAYYSIGCRCQKCKDAAAKYRRERRARLKKEQS